MNPAVEAMLKKYDPTSRVEYERAIKEIIQEIALVGLWRAKFFEHAAFYGETALRILYQLDRFSEDLDFTLLEANPEFSLESYNHAISTELTAYGFEVTVDVKSKEWQTAIKSAFIKANTMGEMLKIGIPSQLTKGLHPFTHLNIKVEVDTDPVLAYVTEARFLAQPVNVGIRSVILPDMYAGKMHALLFREWKGRVKGRDWYDWLWFVRRDTALSLERLGIHMKRREPLKKEEFIEMLEEKIEKVNLESVIADIIPFVADPAPIKAWTKEMFIHFAHEIKFA